MTATITVVVPVLSRPGNAEPLADSLTANTTVDFRLVWVCTPGDVAQIEACQGLGEVLFTDRPAGPGDFALKTQIGYESGDEPYVFCGADDLRFHPGWDTALLAVVDEYDVGVVGTDDMANPSVMAGRHATHPLVSRCYIDTFGGYVGGKGQVYFQGYDHQMVDLELVQTAMARGCYAHCHDSRVAHHHPLYDQTVKTDSTYERGQSRTRADRALYDSRKHLWVNEGKADA